MPQKPYIKLSLFICTFLVNIIIHAQVTPAEKTALQAVFNALGGPNWNSQNDADTSDDWDFTQPVTNAWYGITVLNGYVDKLKLSSFNSPGPNNVIGMLPNEIGNFPNLTYLHVEYADLTGPIPDAIGNLINLEELHLGNNNDLNGLIPATISGMTALKKFYADNNNISDIPTTIGLLNNLEELYLRKNNIANIPLEIGNCTNLKILNLSQNELISIPTTINNLINLEILRLNDNTTLSGTVPNINDLQNLKILDLSTCALTGNLPVINIPSVIEIMQLEDNNFSGGLPPIYGSYTSLKTLNTSYNPLIGGIIPLSFQGMSSIETLDFQEIGLTGNFPPELSNLVTLKNFTVWENNLTGIIPPSYGNLTQLINFIVADNQLSGSIPATIGNIASLRVAYFQSNNFTGTIPASYTALPDLWRFIVNNNQLSGIVPDFTGISASMNWLGISGNAFQFGDFENEFNTYLTDIGTTFNYNSQAKVDNVQTVNHIAGENTTFTVNCSGSQNNYQWFKNNTALTDGGTFSGTQTSTLILNNIQITDAGTYHCEVTSNIVTGLTIERNNITLNVTAAPLDDFITTWKTTLPNESITIPTFVPETYNYSVDWGDGTTTSHINDIAPTHTYAIADDYTVSISGDFPRIYFNNGGDKEKIISINQWGNQTWSSMERAFYGCINLMGEATDTPNLPGVTVSMFQNCSSFNQDISNWDVSNVVNTGFMFSGATSFNSPLNNWDVSNVIRMPSMFSGALVFNQDLNNWNTGNVEAMGSMFRNAVTFNKDIGNWNTGNVENMSNMFNNAINFNQNIGNWNVTSLVSGPSAINMFSGVTLSTVNYDNLLIGWNAQNLNPNIQFSGGDSNYCNGDVARNNMILSDGWVITDAGLLCSASQYSINYTSTINGAIVGDGTTNTDYFGPNNWGGTYGDCTSGNWRWIHALCSECSINNKDISVKQNNANGSTWYAGGGASRYMVIDLSMPRTFNELRVFQMFSDGKVTSLRMYSHIDTATVPIYSDAGWIPIFAEASISAGLIVGDTVSMPTVINFPYTTSRFLLVEAKNDGSLGNPSYTEIRELKLFDNNSSTPAPIDPLYTPTFTQVAPICEGDVLNNLPTTSDNGITGTWSPALNTAVTTEYTFTPSSGQCAETTVMTITINTQPVQPTLECWETAIFNNTTCIWGVTGTQPAQPTIECWETATFNNTTCVWDVTGTQSIQPTIECWETAIFNNTTCIWDVTGMQPAQPTLECWETATFNNATCVWDVTGTQPTQPTIECWETATFNNTTCVWDITGTQPAQPIIECWETATFNNTTCIWDVTGTQPTQPTIECWETATFNNTTCIWDIIGTQPTQPTIECWETATFNNTTCVWDITGTEPEPVDTLSSVTECDSYTLPILTIGNYFTATNGTGAQLNPGESIITTQTIFIYVENGSCTYESSFDVTINQSMDFDLSLSNIEINEQDIVVNMTDLSINYQFSVDGSSYQSSNHFFDLTEGLHTLSVLDENGCIEKTIEFEIVIIRFNIPKYFTPNDDDYNDTWQILDSENSIKTLQIFDRYGKLLKEITLNSNGWDGTINGRKLPTNDYWYLIILHSGEVIRGHFTLKR